MFHHPQTGGGVPGEVGATPAQVGLAWLLAHTPTTLLIPGTRSIAHLEENLGAGDVTLDAEAIARLDAVTAAGSSAMPEGIEGFLEQD